MNYVITENLSKDLSNLLKNDDDYDVKIKVGKEPNVKEFKLHSLILSSRSVYFKRALYFLIESSFVADASR